MKNPKSIEVPNAQLLIIFPVLANFCLTSSISAIFNILNFISKFFFRTSISGARWSSASPRTGTTRTPPTRPDGESISQIPLFRISRISQFRFSVFPSLFSLCVCFSLVRFWCLPVCFSVSLCVSRRFFLSLCLSCFASRSRVRGCSAIDPFVSPSDMGLHYEKLLESKCRDLGLAFLNETGMRMKVQRLSLSVLSCLYACRR